MILALQGAHIRRADGASALVASATPHSLSRSWGCPSEHQWAGQQDAALQERATAARQADIQAKGDLAILFGLFGVTFAVCAVAAGRGRQAEPHAIRPGGVGSTHT